MAHYSINNIDREFDSLQDLITSTPERDLPIFISKTVLKDSYDVLIVGGGIAGLYAAYKILKSKKDANEKIQILILEQSKRTGGRLDTDLFIMNDNVLKEEEGGMRFTFEDMPQLLNLLVELGLTDDIVPFPMHLDDNNRMFYRGKTFSRRESKRNNYKIWRDLYELKNGEKGINPTEIIPKYVYTKIINSTHDDQVFADENTVARQVLDRLNTAHKKYLSGAAYDKTIVLSQKEIQAIYGDHAGSTTKHIEVSAPGIWQFFRLAFKWKGIGLNKWTLWALLADMGYSNECIQMMAKVSGFNGTYFSTMNAGEAFQLLMEFPAEPDFKSLRYGFSQLTNVLIDRISELNTDHCKVNIALNTKVLEIKENNRICIKAPNLEDVLDEIQRIVSRIIKNYHEVDAINKEITAFKRLNNLELDTCIVFLERIYKPIDEYDPRYATKIVAILNAYKNLKNEELYKAIQASTTILALPRVAIEKLINACHFPIKNEKKLWETLESTTNQPLAKINLYYPHAWWNGEYTPNADITFGANFTDLPLGSVYPFYSDDAKNNKIAGNLQLLLVKLAEEEKQETKPEDLANLQHLENQLKESMKTVYTKPAALTIYCDYQNINFWQGFAKIANEDNWYPQSDSIRQIVELNRKVPLESQTDLIKPEYITPASKQMVAAITDYFQLLFQTNRIPKPLATSVRIWEGSQSLKTDAYGDFGYGVHQWGVGTNDEEVIQKMVKPFEDLPIYTCGEAYSDFQGWVEGSLRSTNLVLEKLGIQSTLDGGKDYSNEEELLVFVRATYLKNLNV